MHTLSDIEQATGQVFPPLYRQLDAEGRLSFGGPHPEWFKVVFPALQAAPPVLLVWHDDDRADLLAANYQDFLFRKMVESVLDLEESLLDDSALGDNLQRWLDTHRTWLRADQVQALETWFGQTEAIADGALHEDQADALIREVIGFERINERIPYVQA